MSKELVISASRRETRVAILDDDQVVEVYHQRENEYSLAGSIHKGRVTRVLPGMQSAFVDIGLERDAFLYVSDFFEDNEEYDKIVTSVEEKVLKLDRTPPPPAATGAPAATPEPGGAPVSEPAAAAAEAAPAASPAPAGPAPAENRWDDRDRRGRRGRRRGRGQRGRGLPESKFYSPGSRPAAEPEAPRQETPAPAAEAPVSDAQREDFFVLPGESLAKYTGEHEIAEESTEMEPEPAAPESPAHEALEAVALERQATAAAPVEESAEPARFVPVPEPETAEAMQLVAEESGELAEPAGGAVQETVKISLVYEAETEVTQEVVAQAAAEAASEGAEISDAAVTGELSATQREHSGRYPHRMSRRMRRRGRGGPGETGRGPQPEGRPQEPGPRAAVETRTAAAPGGKPATPSISDLLKEGQEIIVQIAKEPLGQKGARITSHIALPGRFLVYMPTVDHIGVSRKIPSDEERARLKRVLQNNRTGIPGGYIVRTAGEGHTEEELRADMMFLYNLWLDLRQKAERRPAPALLHHDLNVVERVLRDQLTSSFKSIWVDNEEVYEGVLQFVQRFQPALVSRVKLYTRANPIFDEFNVTSELEKALRPKVWLKSGGYIVINQTEALVAIDVNTGKFVGKSNRLEDTIVKTNTDAIKEIVRQIRLRDLGGIIVVDFIDMDERKNRQKVMQTLEEAMRADRAPYKILQFNDFGLVAITRKRVKQSLERTLCTPCPYCEGAGYVKSPQTVVGEILQESHKIAKSLEGNNVMLRVAPDVAKLLKSNQNSFLQEIEEVLGRTVIVKSDALLHQEKFDLA
jgi:ribonuclease G